MAVKAILCLLLTSAGAFAAVDLSGSWTGVMIRGREEIPLYLTLIQNQHQISGTLDSGSAVTEARIEKPALIANRLEFELHDSQGDTMRFRLNVAGTHMTGEAAAGNRAGRIQLEKMPPPSVSFNLGFGVSAPALLTQVQPEYTEEARKAKLQGTVVLYARIDPKGRAADIKVIRSLGMGLDEKAMDAVQRWKFKPGFKGGQAVAVEAAIEVNFRL
ncbi:MAG TPA: energy transducer TonB [Bryobacteraceae bacterium]|nr:energy transducer TonB [Bryobacteraceae bacterium]